MVYTDKEYGYLYQQYKKAESEVTEWITSQSPPNPNGGGHCFSYLGELARKLYSDKKVEMPKELRGKLTSSIELRIKLMAHHEDRGNANAEHEFAITMFGKIAQTLFPPSEVVAITKLVQSTGISTTIPRKASGSISPQRRSKSAPAETSRWQEATTWRRADPPTPQKTIEGEKIGWPQQGVMPLRRGRMVERRWTA